MEIFYTEEARKDLLVIKEFILDKFDDESLANTVLRKIVKNVRSLEIFPYMGAELSTVTNAGRGYRYLVCEHNYVFYRVGENSVHVIRILNEKRDYLYELFTE